MGIPKQKAMEDGYKLMDEGEREEERMKSSKLSSTGWKVAAFIFCSAFLVTISLNIYYIYSESTEIWVGNHFDDNNRILSQGILKPRVSRKQDDCDDCVDDINNVIDECDNGVQNCVMALVECSLECSTDCYNCVCRAVANIFGVFCEDHVHKDSSPIKV